jgi:hypothetical protein
VEGLASRRRAQAINVYLFCRLRAEVYPADKYAEAGIGARFVQDNHTRSARDTIRGLHAQRIHPLGKLVRALAGEIFDLVVNIRRGSPTWLKWIGVELSAGNCRQLYNTGRLRARNLCHQRICGSRIQVHRLLRSG